MQSLLSQCSVVSLMGNRMNLTQRSANHRFCYKQKLSTRLITKKRNTDFIVMQAETEEGVFWNLFSATCRSSRLRPWWDFRGALIGAPLGGTRLRRMAIGGPGGPWVHAWTQNIQGCSNLGPRGQIRTDTSRKREKKVENFA